MKIPIVLFEDNHCIVVLKPFNMLTQGDITGDYSLFDWTKSYIKEKYKKPGNVYLGMIHRLDRPAAGVVLFARTSKAAARLSEQFRTNTVKKKYCAVVENRVVFEDGKSLIHFLKKNRKTNVVTAYDKPVKDAKKSILHFETRQIIGKMTLLEINLETGRSHQIRAQLAKIGHPILGDIKYGATKPLKRKNIALFSYFLAVEHPTKKERIEFCFEPEKEWWNIF